MINHYTKLENEDNVKNKTLSHFFSCIDKIKDKNIIYGKEYTSRDYLGFINASFGDYFDTTIKSLLVGDIWSLETYSVGLGDDLLNLIIDYFYTYPHMIKEYSEKHLKDYFYNFILEERSIDNSGRLFNKSDIKKYISMMKNIESKEICEIMLKNLNPEEIVYIEKTNREKSVIRRSDNLFFDINFDTDFMLKKEKIKISDFNIVLIDGFIDSVGEIHHLLYQASENKQDYVLICKGMRDEVKHTILLNLQRGTINLHPISLNIDEENVNILSDIASILNVDIVSSTKGDVISVELRKDLPVRNGIEISKKGIVLKPQKGNSIELQKKYLSERLKKINPDDPNYLFLKKRLKNLISKKMTIELRSNYSQEGIFEIDGFLKFLKNGKTGIFLAMNQNNNNRIIYSKSEIVILYNKFKSIIKTISNIGCIIYGEQ